jgi:Phospholipase_D-nuclease N-terminal
MEIVMTPWEKLLQFIPYIIPIVLLQLILMIVALIDLIRREKPRWLPKWVWAIIIILGELLGPIVYLVFGREE